MKQNIYDNERFAKQYDTLRFEKQGTNANDLIEIPNFRKLMPKVAHKTILDLGCGYGENDKYFKELGAKSILGIDISNHMIEIANKENKMDGIEYQVMPMEEISNIKQQFDIIISSLAFHYIKDFDQLTSDIHALLKEEGTLVFSQEHPFTTCVVYTENLKKGYTMIDGKYYGVFSDYNRSGKRTKQWFEEEIVKYHRNFSEIVNTLVKNGFMIEEFAEPIPSEETIAKNPKYVNQWDRPFFLFVKAKKIKS